MKKKEKQIIHKQVGDRMTTTDEIIENLKIELTRIGSTNQRDYDLLKKKGQVYSTTICRRLKLSWPEVVKLIKNKSDYK